MYKILYINHVGFISGAERVLINLLSRIDRKKYEPIVAAPSKGTFLAEISKLNIKTYQIDTPLLTRPKSPIHLTKYIPKFWYVTRQLKRIIAEEKIDILHANSFIAMLYSCSAAKRTNRPIIWHMHDIVTPRWFNQQFMRFAGNRASRIIAVSNAVKARLIKLGVQPKKCMVIYNGMDCSQNNQSVSEEQIRKMKSELNISSKAIVIGMFGQIAHWKGQHVLIRAASTIIQRNSQVYFIIVGDIINELANEYKQQIIDLIKDLEISNRIILTGFRTDIPILMQIVDIMVHSSVLPDPLPTVLLEAMVYQKPVIATRVGGVPEIVMDKQTGLLVAPDNIQEMEKAIQTLLDSVELRISFGENGRKRVEQYFNIVQNVATIESIYQELLSHP